MKTKYFTIFSLAAILFSGCGKILDRPSKTDESDDDFWTSETKVRLYAHEFYTKTFIGYGQGFSRNYAALSGYEFNDDMLTQGNQTEFERQVPTSKGSNSIAEVNPAWQSTYTGPTWNFAWVRKANIMIDRVENEMKGILSEEQQAHWLGIGRFFRGLEYSGLATVFGDVPFYDKEISNTDTDELYKPRTPRDEVMDHVYDDFKYALENVRLNDGDQTVNRYVVAGYVSRYALIEGTWQKYHFNNNERASKFFNLAIDAANFIMNSGKFDIVTDFRSLFGSYDLAGNRDCIFYRHYDDAHLITHSIASQCNLAESRNAGPTLDLVKAFICNDGQDWETSTLANADNFELSELIKTRDPRFEASFWHKPHPMSRGSQLYICKFINREGPTYAANGETVPTEYTSTFNKNDYPVMRYAEVLLNWIEAKAELATVGGAAVTQADIDASINKIRNRPLDDVAISRGVKKTAAMQLGSLPEDPNRDGTVPKLIWEIRRERRMELAFEFSRIVDLRRWKKLDYMDTKKNPDLLTGTWVNFPKELPEELAAKNIGILSVINKDGEQIEYNGSNDKEMVGFFRHLSNVDRLEVLNVPGINPYLSPVGRNQINDYAKKGYVLEQTQGWASE